MLSHLIKFAVEGAAVFDSAMSSSFYVDTESDPDEIGEVMFCKNNVCVHLSSLDDSHVPGYFMLKSMTQQSGHVRLLVTWTPNSYFCNNKAETNMDSIRHDEELQGLFISKLCRNSPDIFNVDLSEMKTLRLFYEQKDESCGQLVIGNFENHYKVFHFHHGGLDRITQILQEWIWCFQDVNPLDEDEFRRKIFTVISKRNPKQGYHPEEGRFDPMPVQTWRAFFNEDGQIEDVANFRKATFFGGLSPEVRREAWKFLLLYFPFSSTSEQRELLQKDKEKEYQKIHYSRNILLNYATYNPEVGYNQGMSDLLAPVLAIVQEEVDAFWCFVGLMEGSVFVTSPKDDVMDRQLTYVRELLRMLEAPFYAHLLLQDDNMDMLFCHRWLLLSFKREFFNEEVLKIWEACWSRHETEYFHIFLCVAMIQEYGGTVVEQNMSADDMLQFFTDLSMKMDGTNVLRTARQLLLRFRQLPGIPCSLRGLLSGPGIWDSAYLPEIQCSCHDKCINLYDKSKSQSSESIDENERNFLHKR